MSVVGGGLQGDDAGAEAEAEDGDGLAFASAGQPWGAASAVRARTGNRRPRAGRRRSAKTSRITPSQKKKVSNKQGNTYYATYILRTACALVRQTG